MDRNSDRVTDAALRLPPAERARIAELLLASLEGEAAGWEREWRAEAERRLQAAEADPTRIRPASPVFERLRELYPEASAPQR